MEFYTQAHHTRKFRGGRKYQDFNQFRLVFWAFPPRPTLRTKPTTTSPNLASTGTTDSASSTSMKDNLPYLTKIGTTCAPSTTPVYWGRKFFIAQENKSCRRRMRCANLSCVAHNFFPSMLTRSCGPESATFVDNAESRKPRGPSMASGTATTSQRYCPN